MASRTETAARAKRGSLTACGATSKPSAWRQVDGRHFNQAARNVACIAEALKRGARQAQDFRALGFYVLAPASQIDKRVFEAFLSKDSLRAAVQERASESGRQPEWLSQWFLPVLERLDIHALSWEDVIGFLKARDPEAVDLESFYERCLGVNR